MLLTSWVDGLRRVIAAPAVIAGVFLLTLLMALPLALTMRGLLRDNLDRSLQADEAAQAVNYDWWQEFTSQGPGLRSTFTPSIIGFATTLDSVSSMVDGQNRTIPITAAIVAYLAGWMFVSGGILDRYARQRRTRAHGFFSACGVYFFRFLRLGVIAGVVYGFLFIYVRDWLFTDWYANAVRGIPVERTAFLWRLGMYAIFGTLLLATNLLFDYAKVRAVVEDRRSMVGALSAGLAFIVRHPARALGLYAINALAFLLVVAVWALVAPGAGRAGLSMWLGFLAAQLYLLARMIVKLQFMASQTALFQRSLAHASYAAAPAPVWPESPAAETIA